MGDSVSSCGAVNMASCCHTAEASDTFAAQPNRYDRPIRHDLPTLLTSRAKTQCDDAKLGNAFKVAHAETIMSDSKPYLDAESPAYARHDEEPEVLLGSHQWAFAASGRAVLVHGEQEEGFARPSKPPKPWHPLVVGSDGLSSISAAELPLSSEATTRSGGTVPSDASSSGEGSEAGALGVLDLTCLDGRWAHRCASDPHVVEVIAAGILYWFDGSRSRIEVQGLAGISVELHGAIYRAHFADGCLHWDDGDVWVPTSPSEKQDTCSGSAWDSADDALRTSSTEVVGPGIRDVCPHLTSFSDDGDFQVALGARMEAILENSFSDDGDLQGLRSRRTF